MYTDSPLALADRLPCCPSRACVGCPSQLLLYDFVRSDLPRAIAGGCRILREILRES